MKFLAILLVCASGLAAEPPASRPIVGAIRWDAWHGARGVPGRSVERALGPEKWHWRLPFFARVVSPDAVVIDGSAQAVMDREIEFAANAGLDYWAFVTYNTDDPMNLGLDHYLASRLRSRIKFSLIVEYGNWGRPGAYQDRIVRYARLAAEPGYQKVMDGRPLVFVLFGGEKEGAAWGGWAKFGHVIEEFRALCRRNGAGNPYVVAMLSDPASAARVRSEAGLDAVGAYAVQGNATAAPYAELAAYAERFATRCADTGSEVVPPVMSGWDRRPRVERPMPWEKYQQPMVGIDRYYQTATPNELAAHLRRTLAWIDANPKAAPARAALIYAWNENDEGGWLTPTLNDGQKRLDAIGEVLRR